MPSLFELPFQPISNSTAPAFNSSALTAAALYAIESTSLREWQFPTSRSLRIAEMSGADYYIKTGSSDSVAASTNSMLMLGRSVEVIRLDQKDTHISIMSSTTVTVNVTLGYGY